MNDLSADFHAHRVIGVDLAVPSLAQQALRRVAELTGAQDICIAGGFARGLYMQQILGLDPQMNDIDIFADISVEDFYDVKESIEIAFGTPVRFHVGTFEKEERPRGLIEFALPKKLRAACAGVESIQLNFGEAHPWANPFKYVHQANVGMNQVAIHTDGRVMGSQSFIDDMTNRTMTMNKDRLWTEHDWVRTTKSLDRMLKERPEFHGWKAIRVPKMKRPITGTFWDAQNEFPLGYNLD